VRNDEIIRVIFSGGKLREKETQGGLLKKEEKIGAPPSSSESAVGNSREKSADRRRRSGFYQSSRGASNDHGVRVGGRKVKAKCGPERRCDIEKKKNRFPGKGGCYAEG